MRDFRHQIRPADHVRSPVKSLPLALLALIAAARTLAGEPVLLTHAHAHNDYEHTHPLFDALAQGFCSVEADIYLVNGQLLVAHELKQTRPDRTLQSLYLDPIRLRVAANGGRVYRGGPEFTLLIDLKQDWRRLYPTLRTTLLQYQSMLTTFSAGEKHPGAVVAIITGLRSPDMFAGERLRIAQLDGQLSDLESNPSALLVPWISANWKESFHWNGQGAMPAAERTHLHAIVTQSHAQGRQVRFWGSPDFPDFWRTLRNSGVDLINTDDLPGAQRFFQAE